MKLTSSNMLSSGVSLSTKQATKGLDLSGNSLITGQKSDLNATSFFVANGLHDSSSICSEILKSSTFGVNAIKVGLGSLGSIANALVGMKSTVDLSSAETITSLVSLNNVLNNNVNLLNNQINNTEFNGIKFLNGTVGRNPVLTDKYDTKPVNVRSVATTTEFQGNGRRSFSDIIITNNNNVNVGDTVDVGNVTFTIVGGKPTNENEVQKGTDAAETASNLATGILNNSNEFLKTYDVSVTGDAVNITERTISGNNVGVIVNSTAGGIISQIPQAQTVAFALDPADGNTIEIAGEVFTFRNVPALPNDVLIVLGNTLATVNNLVAVIKNTNPITKALVDNGRLYVDQQGGALRLVAGSEVSAIVTGGPSAARPIVATMINSIAYANTAAVGDYVIVGGVRFDYANHVVNPTDVLPGGNADASCTNLYNAILANPTTAGLIATNELQVSDTGFGILGVYQNGNLAVPTVNSILNNIAAPVNTPVSYLQFAAAGGVNLSGIRHLEGFIGRGNATIEVISLEISGGGDNAAANLMNMSGFGYPTNAVGDGDAAAIISITIEGEKFTGAMFKPNGGNLNNESFVFTNKSTGQFFTINSTAFNPLMTIDGITTPLQNLLNNSLYDQTRDLVITTDGGNVIVSGGVVASVTGMTAELSSTKFTGKEIDDFQITNDNLGNITFTATINGLSYTNTVAAANIGTLVQGFALKLTNVANSDVLTINLGEGGLTNLNVVDNVAPIATAIRNALTNVGSGLLVKTGISSQESLVVKMPNVSLEKIFVDNSGIYLPQFDLTTSEGRRKADEVLTNALSIVRKAEALLKNSGEALDMATTALQNFIQITSDASHSYTDTNLIATAEEFSEALKSLSSAILVLKGVSTISQHAQQIIADVVK